MRTGKRDSPPRTEFKQTTALGNAGYEVTGPWMKREDTGTVVRQTIHVPQVPTTHDLGGERCGALPAITRNALHCTAPQQSDACAVHLRTFVAGLRTRCCFTMYASTGCWRARVRSVCCGRRSCNAGQASVAQDLRLTQCA